MIPFKAFDDKIDTVLAVPKTPLKPKNPKTFKPKHNLNLELCAQLDLSLKLILLPTFDITIAAKPQSQLTPNTLN